jgi:O-antigen/teichoic acid export membrane protein
MMLKDGVLSTLSRLLGGGAKLLAYVLIARFLGAEGQGAFAMVLTVVVTATPIGAMGLDFSNAYNAGRDRGRAGALLVNSAAVSLLTGAVIGGAYLAARRFLDPQLLQAIPRSADWFLVAGIPIQVMLVTFLGVAIGLRRFRDVVVATLLNDGLFLACLVAAGLSGVLTLHVAIALWCLVTAAANLYLAWRILAAAERRAFDWALMREGFGYSLWRYAYAITTALYHRADVYVVAHFMSAQSIGYYTVARSSAEALLYVPKAMNAVVLSYAASDSLDGRRAGLLYRSSVVGLGLAALVMVLLAGVLLPAFFGPDFSASVLPFRILVVGLAFQALGALAMHHLYGLNDPRIPVLATLAGLAVATALSVALVPGWQMAGAAMAASVACVLYMGVLFDRLARATSLDVRALLVPSLADYRGFGTYLLSRAGR